MQIFYKITFIILILLSSSLDGISQIKPVFQNEPIESLSNENNLNKKDFDVINAETPISKSRTQHFAEGNIRAYIISIFKPYFHYSKMSYIGAIMIFLLYLFYFKRIDIYEFEPWKNIIFTFLAGIFFADMGLILYDFSYVVLGFFLNDRIINDLLYCIFVIGGIEELVKIVPLILILRFTKIINEPVDYIVYAGVAALGFAFSENIMYFDQHGPSIILSRALTAVVLHTSLSSIVAYGFILRDYRDKKMAPLKMYFIAMIFHGLYDFFLINPAAQSFKLIAYLILFASITIFNRIISNALSNSPYYNSSIHLEVRKIQLLLVGGLIGIFGIQFLFIAISESYTAATESFLPSLIIGVVLIPTLVSGFGKIQIHPKKWNSIRIPFTFNSLSLDTEEKDLTKVFLRINPMTRNRIMLSYFPNTGEIYKQTTDSKGRLWFYVRLETISHNTKFNNKHIVLRSKFGNELLNKNEGIGMAGVYLINKKTNKPLFVGWASVEELL